jgi:hypothetical protein
MKIVVLYRPNSEYGRVTEEFIHDYRARYPDAKLDILDIDSRDGIAAASLYDVMQFPTIMALRDDGSLLKSWEGEAFPLMDEIASYAYS